VGQTRAARLKTALPNASDTTETAAASKAIYLGNEAVLVEYKNRKNLFDPFFHNRFNTYQLVAQAIRQSLLKGEPPYHNVNAIFNRHAQGDRSDKRLV
jgi:hypothetical protein